MYMADPRKTKRAAPHRTVSRCRVVPRFHSDFCTFLPDADHSRAFLCPLWVVVGVQSHRAPLVFDEFMGRIIAGKRAVSSIAPQVFPPPGSEIDLSVAIGAALINILDDAIISPTRRRFEPSLSVALTLARGGNTTILSIAAAVQRLVHMVHRAYTYLWTTVLARRSNYAPVHAAAF